MVIVDSDEEGILKEPRRQSRSPRPAPTWEEYDEPEEYEPIVAHAEISMGTAVLQLAVPPLPTDGATRKRDTLPELLSRKMVVAVACADRSTHLISFPLKPLYPSMSFLSATAPRHYNYEDIVVIGPKFHHSPPRRVTLSFTSSSCSVHQLCQGMSAGHDSARAQHHSVGGNPDDEELWSMLVASHSAEPSGLLVVFRVPIVEAAGYTGFDEELVRRISTLNLRFPAMSLEFNPSRFPSTRHTQLLVGDMGGFVKIVDISPASPLREVPSSTENSALHPHGHELLTLCCPFQSASKTQLSLSSSSSRTRVIDAKWILNGTGVICLLSDGRWGIWDIEDAGPSNITNGSGATQYSPGLAGGGVTRFSLQGSLGRSTNSASPKTSSISKNARKATEGKKLAPMTPNTRKVRQESLFSNSSQGLKASGLIQGGISISSASGSANRMSHDDSVLMWYGPDVFAIPSLMSYWQRAANAPTSAGRAALHGPSLATLGSISTFGERITSVLQFPRDSVSGQTASAREIQHDVLVSAEHRLVLQCHPRSRDKPTQQLRAALERSDKPESPEVDSKTYFRRVNEKLKAGELSLEEINKELEKLRTEHGFMMPGLFDEEPRPRHVGFAADTRH